MQCDVYVLAKHLSTRNAIVLLLTKKVRDYLFNKLFRENVSMEYYMNCLSKINAVYILKKKLIRLSRPDYHDCIV